MVRCSQSLASSSDFGIWVSAARRNCPCDGFQAWLASKNAKKLNYFWDCWEEDSELWGKGRTLAERNMGPATWDCSHRPEV